MFRFAVRWFATALGIGVAGLLLPGVHVDGAGAAILTALLLGLINATLRPILLFPTLPLTLLTFGAFAPVIDGAVRPPRHDFRRGCTRRASAVPCRAPLASAWREGR